MNYIRHGKSLLVELFNKIKLNLGFRVNTEYGWYRKINDYICHCNHDGLRHNSNGPAVIYTDGTQFWYTNGFFHREDGPAVIYPNGFEEWYLNDHDITDEIHKWAKDRDIDLNNMSEMDKMIIKLEWGNYGK